MYWFNCKVEILDINAVVCSAFMSFILMAWRWPN